MAIQPIGYYRPDLAETNPGVSLTVLNAILTADANGVSYGPHPSLSALSTADALPSAPRGAASVVTRNGSYQAFVGTEDKLYQILSDGSVTEIGTGYALPSGDDWSMAQFGDYIYFTNVFDGMLRYNIETGGTVDAVPGAPAARFIFPLFEALAALDCNGNNRVMQTSAINNAAIWSGDASNNYQEFTEGEELIAGGEIGQSYAIVFQRNAIRLLTRQTDRSLFTSNLYASSIGAQGAAGVVFARGWAYFVDTDGFHRTNGASVEAIGENKVSRTFVASLAGNALTTVQGAHDPSNNRIVWRYLKSSAVDPEIFEDALSFDIDVGEFVPIEIDTTALVAMASPGYTLDELDQFGTMNTLPYSLDSRAWKGGEPRLAGFDADRKFGFLSGANLPCVLETGSVHAGGALRITGTTPITDCASATVQLGMKQSLADDFTWGDAVGIDGDGFAPVDEAGMIYSLRFNVAADEPWSFMRGFDGTLARRQGSR